MVFDGGGVEADVKVKLPKPSALEIALQVSKRQARFFVDVSITKSQPQNQTYGTQYLFGVPFCVVVATCRYG